MRRMATIVAIVTLLAACSGSPGGPSVGAGSASLSMGGKTYEVRDVQLVMETGDSAWFRIDGEPARDPELECMPGLGAGLALYGDLPGSVREPADLVGRRLKVDFTGDGDEANFCFVGMGGLAGAEDAWITIDSVSGGRVSFTMSGSFKIYDENGDGPVESASAKGTAVAQQGS